MTAREEERFRSLYDRYRRAVVAFLIRFGLDREEARDLAQEVFMRVYEHMDTYRGEAEWKFLEVTARRIALNHIREQNAQKRRGATVSIDAIPEARALQPSPEAAYAVQEEQEALRKKLAAAIAELPQCDRTCLQLWLRGCTYTEIERILGTTADAVKSRLRDARIRLKRRLAAEPDGVPWPKEDHEKG